MDIEVSEYLDEGYKPIVHFEHWKVAVLNYIDELEVENIDIMQKHLYTDEVFVLLQGDFTLFTAGTGDEPGKVTATHLEPLKAYTVKKGVWHTHTLEKGTSCLIVENEETNDGWENSPKLKISREKRDEIIKAYRG